MLLIKYLPPHPWKYYSYMGTYLISLKDIKNSSRMD